MSQNPRPDLSGFTVLALDDHDDALYVLTIFLEACGANVIGAADTQQAREVLSSTTPHVIVTDIHMPRETGHAFLRWLRKEAPEHLRQIPVIGLSASGYYTSPDMRRDFSIWLDKPMDYDHLCRSVDTLVKGAI